MASLLLSICSLILLAGLSSAADSNPLECEITGETATLYLATDTEKTVITPETTFDPAKPFFVIIHGWNENSTRVEYKDIAAELYLETNGTVVMVDYDEFAHKFYGTCAFIISNTVGDFVTDFIVKRIDAGQIKHSQIHLIGHSLGGQIAGYIGRAVYDETEIKINRISALDAAGPLFSVLVIPLPDISLSADDAVIVDALHTSLLLGALPRIGTIDFYVKGLLGLPILSAACGLFSTLDACSHALSVTLFRESIRSCGIIANHWIYWSRKIVYGFHMPITATGTYDIYPAFGPPYGKGDPDCSKIKQIGN